MHEKIAGNPETEGTVGAPVVWLAGLPEQVGDIVRMMREDGIERATINVEAHHHETEEHADLARRHAARSTSPMRPRRFPVARRPRVTLRSAGAGREHAAPPVEPTDCDIRSSGTSRGPADSR